MRRFLSAVLAAAVVAAVAAGGGLADAGTGPGTTFPEAPGSNVQGACAAVSTNPGTGFGGVAGPNMAPTANSITNGILVDACFGG